MIAAIKGLLAAIFLAGAQPAPPPPPSLPSVLFPAGHEARVLDVLVPLVAKWEGKRNLSYPDIVGVPTICFGHTEGVRLGDHMTDAECQALLRSDLVAYHRALLPAFSAETAARRLPPPRHAAFDSLGYNVGPAGVARSTAVRRLNASDVPGACEALTWWNKAGGRVVRGLVARRSEERELCLVGVR